MDTHEGYVQSVKKQKEMAFFNLKCIERGRQPRQILFWAATGRERPIPLTTALKWNQLEFAAYLNPCRQA